MIATTGAVALQLKGGPTALRYRRGRPTSHVLENKSREELSPRGFVISGRRVTQSLVPKFNLGMRITSLITCQSSFSLRHDAIRQRIGVPGAMVAQRSPAPGVLSLVRERAGFALHEIFPGRITRNPHERPGRAFQMLHQHGARYRVARRYRVQ